MAYQRIKIRKILAEIFTRQECWQFVIVIVAALIMAVFQAFGVASFLPFVQVVTDATAIHTNSLLSTVYMWLGFKSDDQFVIFMGVVVLAVIIVGNCISAFATWLRLRFAWQVSHRISVTLLRKYLSLPYSYFLNHHTSDLGKNVLFETQQLTNGFLLPLLRLITGSLVSLIILGMLVYVDSLIASVTAGVLISLYLFIYLKFRKRVKAGGSGQLEENKERFKLATEALAGIKDIKVLGREEYMLNRFAKHSQKFSRLQSWSQVISQVPGYTVEMVAFGGVVGLALYLLFHEEGREIIPLISFFALAGYRLMPALQEIFKSFTSLQFNKAILQEIYQDLSFNSMPSIEALTPILLPVLPLPFNHKISINNVSFSYQGSSVPILQNITLEVPKHKSVAVVGSTGSGKTTLIDIMMGLLRPESGVLKVDDNVIDQTNTKNWQRNLGYVPQQIYLADDTIAHNIAFGLGDSSIDMQRIEYVARIANISDFVNNQLPEGFRALIGERGVRLSGGQRQRIGIARALYHDPEVLILDEATSSLDGVTEEAVLKAVKNVAQLKTLIIVAHKFTAIKDCDTIFVLDKGKVIAQGTYKELIEHNDHFRKMARAAQIDKLQNL